MEYLQNRAGLKAFASNIARLIEGKKVPIILCVGSDKFVCDALGPMVAEILKKKYCIPTFVYGGLEYNINAQNLTETLNYIETVHAGNPIILVDATVGENLGRVRVTNGSFAGLGRALPIRKIGTFSVLGVVGKGGKEFMLNSTRLKVVVDLSRFIAMGLALAFSVCGRQCRFGETDVICKSIG